MATLTFHGNQVNTAGTLPAVGSAAPQFCLTGRDLGDVTLAGLRGRKVVLNIFPSIDTPVCATSVRRFNEEASALGDTTILAISADLPFAVGRFCAAEGLENVVSASVFRSPEFGKDYGVVVTDGALRGLLSRAIVVIDTEGKVLYTEHVPEITTEPNYAAALQALK